MIILKYNIDYGSNNHRLKKYSEEYTVVYKGETYSRSKYVYSDKYINTGIPSTDHDITWSLFYKPIFSHPNELTRVSNPTHCELENEFNLLQRKDKILKIKERMYVKQYRE